MAQEAVIIQPWQTAAIHNPFVHFAFFGGVGVGKTFTGSHFSISHIENMPRATGFIGANTYDQLSQATLREFFYWLDYYGYEFVVDRQPPPGWNGGRKLKKYDNTVSVRNPRTEIVTLIFTRVLGEANPLRGVEFTWYWLDETRDTPQITHDVVISRMRETPNYMKGIITTTTNGEDWTYNRFVKGLRRNDWMYGSMHVPTYHGVEAGYLTQQYYDSMRRSYSELLAQQELDALHVNVLGGRAYYAAGEKNRLRVAPWGDSVPDRARPLVVGCDFNFSPAPCVWMLGQVGPPTYTDDGRYWGDHIHWFGEISGVGKSTVDMTELMMGRYPDFFYEVYGDCSGGIGTTSNAGETDFHQISNTIYEGGGVCSINHFQTDIKANPKVRSRVENMNRLFSNSMGEVRQTYDPISCPLFDADMKMVGWKPTTLAGRGRLDDGGNNTLTHATDGAGYACYKIFPPQIQGRIVESIPSSVRSEFGLLR